MLKHRARGKLAKKVERQQVRSFVLMQLAQFHSDGLEGSFFPSC